MDSTSSFTHWAQSIYSKPPDSQKRQYFYDAASILESGGGGQLIENFQRIVDNIFACDPGEGGNLLTVSPIISGEYNAYYDLLNVSGIVFHSINRLMAGEPTLRFQVHTSDIDRVSSGMNRFSGVLELNPFEYYFFRFAEYLLNAANSYPDVDSDQFNCVYIALLNDYLSHFLPPNGVFPTGIGRIGDDHLSVEGHWSDRYLHDDGIGGGFMDSARRTPHGLLRRDLFRSSPDTLDFASPHRHLQSSTYSDMLWKSSTFLSILLDCWFSVPNPQDRSPVNAAFRDHSLSSAGFQLSSRSRPNATVSIITAVNRMVVAHLHHFTYGPSSAIVDSQIRDFKEHYVPKLLDARIWAYLEHAFESWPLDSSFRVLLELWFTYIQPWRYAQVRNDQQAERNYDIHWERFVKEHEQFYDRFFRAAVERLRHMDLTAYRNAAMLYRLAEVFGDAGLVAALDWKTESASYNRLPNGDARSAVVSVARHAQGALKACENALIEEKNASSQQSWFIWIGKLLASEDDGPSRVTELDGARRCLDTALQYLQIAFDFRLSSEVVPVSGQETVSQLLNGASLRPETEPDCEQDDDGRLCLTPLGRRQLLNSKRRFDFSRVNWPSDLKPIDYSNEIAFLAQLLQNISSRINTMYEKKLVILYRRPRGIVPWILRKCLEPPTRLARRNSPVVERRPNELKARINLRPIASYRFLLTFALVWLLSGMILNFSTVTAIFAIVLLVIFAWFYWVLEYYQ